MLNYFTHLTFFKHFGSSTCSHVHNRSHDTYGQHAAGDGIWTCEHIEDPKCLKRVRCFWCYSASTKTSFVFCSCSELLQLKFGKRNFAGKCELLSPQDSYRGELKVANEKYLPYLQLCGKASMWIFMYCRCKSGPKLRQNNKNWGLPQDTNKQFVPKYFVRSCNIRYLGEKKY